MDHFFSNILKIRRKTKTTNIFEYVDKILDHTADKEKQRQIFGRLSSFMSGFGKDFSVYAHMTDATLTIL